MLADLYDNGVYTTGSDIATSRQLLKERPRQLKAFIMALTEGTAYGRANKDQTMRIYRKYLKIEEPKLLESIHKNYLLGTIPAKPYPREEALQNDIEDLSYTYADLKERKPLSFSWEIVQTHHADSDLSYRDIDRRRSTLPFTKRHT